MKRLILVAALCAIATITHAESKHVKFTTAIVIDGQPVVSDIKCPMIAAAPTAPAHRDCQTPYTVGELAYASLERAPDRGQPQSWADAIKHDDLAHAIRDADDFLLLDEQRTSIEAAMASAGLSPAILGFVARVIDPPTPATPVVK